MANRYWVGGSGTWDTSSTTNWSRTSGGTGGATVPIASDNVFFDQAGTYTVNVSGGTVFCLNFTVSAGAVTINAGQLINIAGNMSLTSSTVMTSSPTMGALLTGTNPNLSFSMNGADVTACEFNFSGVGGAWYFGSALTLGDTKTLTLTNGSIILNGYNITCGIFSSSNANTRSIIFGSNNITLNHPTAATTVLNMATGTGLTCTGTGGFVTDASITRTITCCTTGAVTNAPNVTLTSGSSVVTLTQPGKFNKLDFGTTAFNPGTISVDLYSLVLSPNGTYTGFSPQMASASGITSTMTTNGKTISNLVFTLTTGTTTLLDSVTTAANAITTFISGTLNLNGFNLTTGQFSSTNTNTRSILFGAGNIILNHSTPGTNVLDMATVTGFTYTATTGGWVTNAATTRTVIFGTTGGTAANSPNLTFTGSGSSVVNLQTGSWFKNLDFGTTAFSPGTTSISFQNLILSATGTYSGVTALMVGTGAITPNGNTTLLAVTMNTASITMTLPSALTITGNFIFAQGTLTLNGFDLTVGTFSTSVATARTIAFGANNIILNSATPATTALSASIMTSFSWTGTGGFRTDASITRTIAIGNIGGTSTNAPNLTFTGSGNQVITFTGLCWFNTLDFGTTTFNPGTAQISVNSLILSATGGYSSLTVNFIGTGSLNTNNATLTLGFAVNHTGTTTLLSNVTCSFSVLGGVTLTSGTLNLNNFTITTQTFNSSNSNTRSIQFGTGNIVLYYIVASTTVIGMNIMTGFTCTGTGGFRTDADYAKFITIGIGGGATSANAPNLTLTGTGSQTVTLSSGGFFNTLNFGNTTFNATSVGVNCNSLILSGAGTYSSMLATMIGTGTITTNSNNTLSALTINAPGGTVSLASATTLAITGITTLTAGTFALNGFDLITGTFSSNNSNTRTLSLVNNVITLRTTTAAQVNLDMATMTGFSIVSTLGRFIVDTNITRSFSVGSTAGGTSTNAPSISFTTPTISAPTITTGSWFNNFNTSLIGGITFGSSVVNVNSMDFSATNTYTNLSVTLRGTTTFNTGGKSLAAFGVNNGVAAGTVTLGANVTAGSFTLTSGTLDLSTFSVTATTGGTDGNIAGGTLLGIGTLACQQLTISGTFTHTTGTLGPSVALNISGGTFTFSGGLIYSVPTVTQTGGTFILSKAYSLATTGAYNLNGGTLTLNGFDLTTGTFLNNATVSSHTVNFGTNYINLVTTTAAQTNINMSTTSGTSSFSGTGGFKADASVARTFSIGNTAGGSFTRAPNLFITGSGTSILTFTTGSWFNTLDFNTFGTTAFTVPSTTINVISLTLNNQSTANFTGLTATFVGDVTRPGTLTSNGKQLAAVTLNSSNTVTIADAANTLGTFTFVAGTLNNASTITANAVSVNGTGTYSQGTLNVTTTFTIASGTFNYNSGTIALNQTTGSFVHTAGTFNVNAEFSIGSLPYTFTAGTINLNNFNLTVGRFNSSVSGVRTINFGANNIVLADTTAGQTVLFMPDATSFTWTATTGGFRSDASVTRTYTFGTTGGSTTTAPNLSITSGSAVPTFTDGSWFKSLNFTGSTCTPAMSASVLGINVDTLTLSTDGTYTNLIPVFTRSQTWIPQFSKQLGGMGFNLASGTLILTGSQSFTATSVFILTQGTLDLGGANLTVGAFISTNNNVRSIIFGVGSIILNHSTAGTTVLNMSFATNFTYTGSGQFLTDATVTRTVRFGDGAFAGTTATSPSIRFTGTGSSVISIISSSLNSSFNTLDFGNTAFDPGVTTVNVASLSLSSNGTYGSLTVTQTTSGSISLASKTIAALTINIAGGTSTMSGSGTVTGATTLTAGTINLANNSLITGTFSSDNSNVRSIIFGNGAIHLNTNTAGQTCLAMATATNFTCTYATGGFTTNCSVTRTFSFGSTAGGSVANAPNLSFSTGSSLMTVTTGSWFTNFAVSSPSTSFATATLNVSSFSASTANISSLTLNMVASGTIDCQGGSTPAGVNVNCLGGTTTLNANLSLTFTSTFVLVAGTLNLNGFAIGAGIFSSSGSVARSITFGSGSYIQLVHTTAGTTVLAMADVTNFSYTGTSDIRALADTTRTFTFGTTGGSTTNSLNLNITSGASTPTFTNGSWFNRINFTGSTAGPTGTVNVNDCILASGGTYTALGLTLRSGTLPTFNGKAIGPFEINNGANTTTLTAAVSCSTFIMTAGTINFATFNLTCSSTATYTSGTMNNIGTITCTTFVVQGTYTLASGTISPSAGFTLTSGAFTLGSGGSLAAVPTVTHTAGTLTLGKAYALTTTGIYLLTAGTLNLGGFNLTTGTFSSTNANTRSIVFGTGNIVLATTTAAATNIDMANATGFTYTGTGGFVSDASVTRTYQFGVTGGSITNAPNLSITSGASVPTFNDGSWFNSLNFTGSTCTPAMTAQVLGINVSTLTLASGGTYTSFIPAFTSTQTWTPQFSLALGGMGINGAGITVTLGGAQTFVANATLTLTQGTLNLNGYNLTVGIFSSNNSNIRSLIFGSSYITILHSVAATTVLNMANATGFTISATTGGFVTNADTTRTLTFGTTGGTNLNSPNVLLTGSNTSVITFTTGSWFNNLDFGTTNFNPGTLTLNLNGFTLSPNGFYNTLTANMVGTGSIVNQVTASIRILGTLIINSNNGTTTISGITGLTVLTAVTLTSGVLNLTNIGIQIEGTAGFTSSNTNTRSIIFGTNYITFSSTVSSAVNMAIATGFTCSGTGGFRADCLGSSRTYTFGTTGGSADNAPNLIFTGTSTNAPILTTGSWFKTLDFGSTSSYALAATTINIAGNLTLSNSGTPPSFVNLTVTMVGTGTITANARPIAALTINSVNGTTTLAGGALVTGSTATTTLISGTLNLNGFALNTGTFSSNNANPRSIIFGSANILLTTTVAASTNIDMANATNFTSTSTTGGFNTLDMSITRTFTFGTTGGSATNAPNLTITGGNAVPTFTDGSWFKTLNFTGNSSTPAMTATNIGIYVDTLTLASLGTYTSFIPVFTRTQTWTMQQSKQLLGIGFNLASGTLTLEATQSYVGGSSKLFLYSGTINLASITLSIGNITTGSDGIFTNMGAVTCGTFVVNAGSTYQHTNGSLTITASMTVNGTFSQSGGTVSSIATITLNAGGTISSVPTITCVTFTANGGTILNGNVSSTTFGIGASSNFTFNGGSIGGAITMTSGTFTYISGLLTSATSFTHTAGTLSLFGSPTFGPTSTYTFTAGTININGYTLTTGIFSSSNATVRTINFGTGSIALAHTTAGTTVLAMGTSSNCTMTGTGGFTSVMSVTRTFDCGSTAGTTFTPNLRITSGASVPTFVSAGTSGTTSSSFNILDFTGSTCAPTSSNINAVVNVSTLILASGGTYTSFNPCFTRTQTWTPQFNKQLGGMAIAGSGITVTLGGTQTFTATGVFTLQQGTLDLGGYNFTISTFSSTTANTRSIIFGSNSITTDGSNLIAIDMTNAGNFSCTGTGGFIINFLTFNQTVTIGSGGVPVIAPNVTIGPSSLQVTLTSSSVFQSLTFSSSYTGTLLPSTSVLTVTSLTLSAAATYSTLNIQQANGSGTITTNGKTLASLAFNAPGGTITLGSAVSVVAAGVTTLTQGTLILNGYDLTTGLFNSNGATTRSISFGNNNIVLISSSSGGTALDAGTVTGFTWTGNGGFVTDSLLAKVYNFGGTAGGSAANAPNLTFINSGTIAPTFTTGSWFNTLDLSRAVHAGVIAATTLNLNSLTLSTQAYQHQITVNLVGSGTITSNGMPIAALTINHSGISTLVGNLSMGLYTTSAATTTLTQGTLNLNGYTLTTGAFVSTTSNIRSIKFGSSNIVLNHTTDATTVLNITSSTNFTWTGTGGFITDDSLTRTYTGGGRTNLTFVSTLNAAVPTMTNTSFNKIDFGTTSFTLAATSLSVGTLILSPNGTYTNLIPFLLRPQTWTMQHGKMLGGMGINANNGTVKLDGTQTFVTNAPFTLSGGTLDLNGYDLTVGSFTGGSFAFSPASINFGSNNIILNHTTPATTVLNFASSMVNFTWTGTGGFVSDASITRTFTFGTNGGSVTSAIKLRFTGTGTAAQTFTTNSWFNTLDFGTTVCSAGTTTLNLTNLTLSATGSFGSCTPNMVATGTIRSNGNTSLASITLNVANITTTLADSLTQQFGTLNLTQGTFDLNGFTFTVGSVSSNNTNTRSIAFGSGNIVISGGVSNPINMATVTGFTCTGTGGFVSPAISQTFNFGGTAGGSAANAPNLTFTGSLTVTPPLATGSWFKNLNFGSITATMGGSIINIAGNLTLSSTGSYASMQTVLTGTGSITTNGNTSLSIVTINTAGTITLASALGIQGAGSPNLTLTAGTLDLNGYNITVAQFTSSNTNVRSLLFGTGNITITGTNSTVISMADMTNFSRSGTGSFVFTNVTGVIVTMGSTAGGSAANAPNLAVTENFPTIASRNITITSLSWINTFDCSTTTATPVMSSTGGGAYINISTFLTSSSSISLYTTFTPAFTRTQTWTIQNGKMLGGIGVNGSGVTLTLDGTQTFGTAISNTSWLNLISGTLVLGGFDLIIGGIFSTNANTRSISFGSNNIVLSSTVSQTAISMGTATNFTWTGTGGFVTTLWVSKSFSFGSTDGSAANAPNLTITEGNATATFSSSPWFKNLSFTTSNVTATGSTIIVDTLTLSPTGVYTSLIPIFTTTRTWTAPYSYLQLGGIGVNGSGVTLTLDGTQKFSPTSTLTLTQGTLDLGGYNLTVGSFASSNTNTRAVNFGSNNINLLHTTAGTTVISMAIATNFTWTGTGGFVTDASVTRTYTVGTTGGSTTTAPNLTINSGAATPTFTDGSWFKTLNFTGSTCTPAMSASLLGINVDTLTLASGGTYTSFIPSFTRTQTWTAQFSKPFNGLILNTPGVTLTLDGTQTFTATANITLTYGTLSLTGTVTVGTFVSNNTNTRAINFGSNNIILATTTASATNLEMSTATNFTWTGTGGFRAASDIIRIFSFGNTAGGSEANAPNLALISGAAVPTFTSGTSFSWFNILNFTGSTFTAPAATLYVNTLILAVGGTYTSFAPILTRSQTWTAQFSKQLGGFGFYLLDGTLTLDGTQTFTGTSVFRLIRGTLDLGGTNLTIGAFVSNSLNVTDVRKVNFGANRIILNHTTAGFLVLDVEHGSTRPFTWTGTESSGFATAMTTTRLVKTQVAYQEAGPTFRNSAPNLFVTSGASSLAIEYLSAFNILDFTGSTCNVTINTIAYGAYVNKLILASGGTYSSFTPFFTGAYTVWTPQFGKQLAGIGLSTDGEFIFNGLQSFSTTGSFFFDRGTLTLNGYDLTVGTLAASNYGGNPRSINFGSNNINIVSPTAAVQGMILPNVTNFSFSGTGGFTADAVTSRTYNWGGSAGASSNGVNLTFTGVGAVASIQVSGVFNHLNFGGIGPNLGVSSVKANSLTLSANAGASFGNLSFTMVGTGTLNANGKTTSAGIIDHTGTTTLLSALTVPNGITYNSGTINLNGFNLSTGGTIYSPIATATTRRFIGPGNYTIANGITITNGSGFSMTGVNIIITVSTTITYNFNVSGASFGTLVLPNSSPVIITVLGSNTFENIALPPSPTPALFKFQAGSTQTVNAFTLSGIGSSSPIYIESTVPGTQATISNPNQVISADYLVLKDINATGGASWYANTSVNNGNNTGWNFTAPPATAPITGQGFALL